MLSNFYSWMRALAPFHLSPNALKRVQALKTTELNEFGVDPFGCDPKVIGICASLLEWLYLYYFRCEVEGIENVPSGRVMVIANHSGQLPFDGLMIATAFFLEFKTPRLLRPMLERWCAELPFISIFLSRLGGIVGQPNACKRLLAQDEAVLVFPEGVRGISKLFKNRYELLPFGHGFMRLAFEANSPVLPIAVLGAEEQAPAVINCALLATKLKMPALTLSFPQILPFPLPVKYRIHIGKPLYLTGDSKNSNEVAAAVQKVRHELKDLLQQGLKKRKNIFF